MPRGILPKSEVVVVMVCEWGGGGGGGQSVVDRKGNSVLTEISTLLQSKMCDFPTPILNT